MTEAPAEVQEEHWLDDSGILSVLPASGYGLHPQHGHIQGHKGLKTIPNPCAYSDCPVKSVGLSGNHFPTVSSKVPLV